MYQQELARSGEALFKVRGKYLRGVIAVGAVIAYFSGPSAPFDAPVANQAWFWLSLAVASAGALLRIVTSGFAAIGTSGVTKDAPVAAELNTTGPYSLVRNPLYVGRILNFTGIAMLSGSWVYGLMVFLVSVLVYERISVYEEEFLRKEFGEAHGKWALEVPFLLPRLHGWITPKYPFSTRRCVFRENKKVFLLITAVALYDLARHGFDVTHLTENLLWYGLYAAVVVAWWVVRLLRRFGSTFDGMS